MQNSLIRAGLPALLYSPRWKQIYFGDELSLNFASVIVRGIASILFAIFKSVASLVAVRAVHGILQQGRPEPW